MTTTGERTGRPPGSDGSNKDAILAAARHEFAANGFRGATMRAIAARAGVDIALLSHYFRNKDGLYAATLELPASANGILAIALNGPLETQGERLTRSYLSLWEDPATSAQMQALARAALGNEAVTARIPDIVSGTANNPEVVELLAGRQTGFILAISHLVGVAVTRYLARVPPMAGLDLETLVARVAPAVQLHLNTRD